MNNSPQSQSKTSLSSPAEWISLGVSLSILVLVLGLVIYSWITKENKPPILSVISGAEIRQVNEQFYIPFEVTNQGGETVQSVEIIAQLTINGEVIETGSQEIDFLSGGEVQSGAFIFSRNPQQGELVMRAVSYKLP